MTILDAGELAKQRLEKIKSTGYWRVNIRPTKFEESRIGSLSRCWELVEFSKVSLRGWAYPHVKEEEKAIGEDWVQSGADFDTFGHVELWRFYQSGQFIHYFSCREDYRMENVNAQIKHNIAVAIGQEGSSGLSVLSTLYSVTEIVEFAARLAQKEVLQPGLEISIKLLGMRGRQLFFWNSGRELRDACVCQVDKITFEEKLSAGQIIAKGHSKALDATIYIFEGFGWFNPNRSILAEDQRRLLERRL